MTIRHVRRCATAHRLGRGSRPDRRRHGRDALAALPAGSITRRASIRPARRQYEIPGRLRTGSTPCDRPRCSCAASVHIVNFHAKCWISKFEQPQPRNLANHRPQSRSQEGWWFGESGRDGAESCVRPSYRPCCAYCRTSSRSPLMERAFCFRNRREGAGALGPDHRLQCVGYSDHGCHCRLILGGVTYMG